MELANSSVNKKYQINICTLNPISIGNLYLMLNIKFIDQLLHVVYLLQIETYSGLAEVLQCQEKAPSNTVEYIKTLC